MTSSTQASLSSSSSALCSTRQDREAAVRRFAGLCEFNGGDPEPRRRRRHLCRPAATLGQALLRFLVGWLLLNAAAVYLVIR